MMEELAFIYGHIRTCRQLAGPMRDWALVLNSGRGLPLFGLCDDPAGIDFFSVFAWIEKDPVSNAADARVARALSLSRKYCSSVVQL